MHINKVNSVCFFVHMLKYISCEVQVPKKIHKIFLTALPDLSKCFINKKKSFVVCFRHKSPSGACQTIEKRGNISCQVIV